jgi:gamma-glutamyltranspeptidase/glutathione hydrolase
MIRKGGNAFDAAVAAGFASAVAEPTLTSLGGGGFLLAHVHGTRKDILIDFFVNTPGLGSSGGSEAPMIPVDVRFKSSVQRFHAGIGSVAVPGTLKGLIHCYRTLCTLDIDDIVGPALRALSEGVEASEYQAYLFEMLKPILGLTGYGREIFRAGQGQRFFNPLLREFLSLKSPDSWIKAVYGADIFAGERKSGECLLTPEDFREYRVIERIPLIIPYRGYDVITNPPPSFGGLLLKLALSLLDAVTEDNLSVEERYTVLACLMGIVQDIRQGNLPEKESPGIFDPGKISSARDEFLRLSKNLTRLSAKGTTHISILDSLGNAASMTVSNGSNSGCFLGDTGIMLNNMMGEDDLHSEGFYTLPPGVRVSSMMSPACIMHRDNVHAVLGSGGSKRIRTAMLQAIVNLLDLGMPVSDAIEHPRLHLDDDSILQLEPGFPQPIIERLNERYPLNVWKEKDMYFGGVHTVVAGFSGHGDSRRGGCFKRG